jgi:hypothetical protein
MVIWRPFQEKSQPQHIEITMVSIPLSWENARITVVFLCFLKQYLDCRGVGHGLLFSIKLAIIEESLHPKIDAGH